MYCCRTNKERQDKEKTPVYKDVEMKEKHNKKEKDEKREEIDKDRDREREKRKERKEEKLLMKEERQYRVSVAFHLLISLAQSIPKALLGVTNCALLTIKNLYCLISDLKYLFL